MITCFNSWVNIVSCMPFNNVNCCWVVLVVFGGRREEKDFITTFLAWPNNNFHFYPSMNVVSCMLLNIANCLIAQEEAKEQQQKLWGGQDTMNRQFFCLFVSFFAYWRNCIIFSSLFVFKFSIKRFDFWWCPVMLSAVYCFIPPHTTALHEMNEG